MIWLCAILVSLGADHGGGLLLTGEPRLELLLERTREELLIRFPEREVLRAQKGRPIEHLVVVLGSKAPGGTRVLMTGSESTPLLDVDLPTQDAFAARQIAVLIEGTLCFTPKTGEEPAPKKPEIKPLVAQAKPVVVAEEVGTPSPKPVARGSLGLTFDTTVEVNIYPDSSRITPALQFGTTVWLLWFFALRLELGTEMLKQASGSLGLHETYGGLLAVLPIVRGDWSVTVGAGFALDVMQVWLEKPERQNHSLSVHPGVRASVRGGVALGAGFRLALNLGFGVVFEYPAYEVGTTLTYLRGPTRLDAGLALQFSP